MLTKDGTPDDLSFHGVVRLEPVFAAKDTESAVVVTQKFYLQKREMEVESA